MRKPFYIFSAYTLGFLLCFAFFNFLIYLFQLHVVIGLLVLAFLCLTTILILTDPETVQELNEQD